jgi:hypothetical protein
MSKKSNPQDALIVAVSQSASHLAVVARYAAAHPSKYWAEVVKKCEQEYRSACDALFAVMGRPAINWKESAQ